MHAADSHRRPDRLAAGFVGLLVSLGSLVLVAIPIGWLWLLSQLGQSYLAVYFLALAGCPLMMAAWGIALARLSRTYSRRSGEGAGAILEASIVLAVVVAILILVTWIVLNPSGGGPIQGPWPG